MAESGLESASVCWTASRTKWQAGFTTSVAGMGLPLNNDTPNPVKNQEDTKRSADAKKNTLNYAVNSNSAFSINGSNFKALLSGPKAPAIIVSISKFCFVLPGTQLLLKKKKMHAIFFPSRTFSTLPTHFPQILRIF